jgi:hypothetical protein
VLGVFLMKKVLLASIAALFLSTGAAHTETNVRGCFVRFMAARAAVSPASTVRR